MHHVRVTEPHVVSWQLVGPSAGRGGVQVLQALPQVW